MRVSALALLTLALAGCAPTAPPRWVEGGAPLLISPAIWQRADEGTVEILPNGQVLEDGQLRFLVDRAGRVVDDDGEPFALLLPDGRLVGTNAQPLGYVGMHNAAPPSSSQAWLSLQPDGQVVFYEANGDRSLQGAWHGCDGPAQRTCTLVTQVFTLRHYRPMPVVGISIGVGMGFGF